MVTWQQLGLHCKPVASSTSRATTTTCWTFSTTAVQEHVPRPMPTSPACAALFVRYIPLSYTSRSPIHPSVCMPGLTSPAGP